MFKIWSWVKGIWEDKKQILVDTICRGLDAYRPALVELIKRNADPEVCATAIIHEIKIFLIRQI